MTEYRRYQGRSYLVWSGNASVGGYEYPMLTQNKIPGLLQFRIANADEQEQFWYDISGMQTLKDWMTVKKAGSGLLKKVMTALAQALQQTGEYLLNEDGISLDPERIFISPGETDIAFCYMPFEKACFLESLRGFMEFYISHMEHADRADAGVCYEVYEKCQQGTAPFEEILELLYAKKEGQKESFEQEQEPVRQYVKAEPEQAKPKDFWHGLLQRAKHRLGMGGKKKKYDAEAYAYEPKDDTAQEDNPTVFLGSETDRVFGELKYEGDGNAGNLSVTGNVYLIGSRKEDVDGLISHETVSRIHARITKEEETFYLEDLNSTNGTYQNGRLLHYKERAPLKKNDKVSFAKETYRFV